MPASKPGEASKLSDLKDKLHNAKEAARSDDAGEREKADLKLLEQEVAGEKLKAKHPPKPPAKNGEPEVDKKLDKALKDTFPGSDPVSIVEPAAPKQDEAKKK